MYKYHSPRIIVTVSKNTFFDVCNMFHFFQLCFKKGDVITITQVDDEGWWEGTLHDKTGWFPSNYVKEYRIPGTVVIVFRFGYFK